MSKETHVSIMFGIIKFLSVIFLIELIGLTNSYNIPTEPYYHYSEEYIRVPVDHFNFVNSNTFLLRYLKNNSYVKDIETAPIFFYCGNEADINVFGQITGFIWEAAEQFKAEIIFAEHRYYGKSLPFGNDSFDTNDNIGYLTSEQALADFAYLLDDLLNHNYRKRPVIAFGGSYGGVLAAWFRMKYPHIVTGALAASAPMLKFVNMIPCNSYYDHLASVFENAYTKSCTSNIKRFSELLRSNDANEDYVRKIFKFCDPNLTLNELSYLLENVYWNIGMGNYPYESDLIELLPANPVREFCKNLDKEYKNNDLIDAMQKSVNIYKNYTGDTNCLDLLKSKLHKRNYIINPWYFQRCTQFIVPMCINKNNTMFLDDNWNYENTIELCKTAYKVQPRDHDTIIRYGGSNFDSASNIIFSNGLLDPWSPAGVLKSSNEKISIIIIPDGAHHIDLKSSHPKDPLSVREARKKEISIISRWIKEFYSIHPIVRSKNASKINLFFMHK